MIESYEELLHNESLYNQVSDMSKRHIGNIMSGKTHLIQIEMRRKFAGKISGEGCKKIATKFAEIVGGEKKATNPTFPEWLESQKNITPADAGNLSKEEYEKYFNEYDKIFQKATMKKAQTKIVQTTEYKGYTIKISEEYYSPNSENNGFVWAVFDTSGKEVNRFDEVISYADWALNSAQKYIDNMQTQISQKSTASKKTSKKASIRELDIYEYSDDSGAKFISKINGWNLWQMSDNGYILVNVDHDRFFSMDKQELIDFANNNVVVE